MPKTPLAFAALGTGTLFIISGLKGVAVGDVLSGKPTKPLDPKGWDPSSTDTSGGTGSAPAAPAGGDFAANPGSPGGTIIFDGKPVAAWIVSELRWARNSAPPSVRWRGRVTSGYRDPRVKVIPSPGLPVAPQGKSNHNKTVYPGGAVDVTDADGLEAALRLKPGGSRLVRGTLIGDPIHFSATGR